MKDRHFKEPPIYDDPLLVAVADDEIILNGFVSIMPSLTIKAARETAQRLEAAADALEVERRRKLN